MLKTTSHFKFSKMSYPCLEKRMTMKWKSIQSPLKKYSIRVRQPVGKPIPEKDRAQLVSENLLFYRQPNGGKIA